MRGSARLLLASFVALSAVGLMSAGPASAAAHTSGKRASRVCALAPAGQAACQAYLRTDSAAAPRRTRPPSRPSGLTPADLQSAYALPSASAGAGQTIAIVDAYNDPTAESDLAVYRSQFGLPACTKASGCFRQVNQSGGTALPPTNASWAQEISLDLDMASAICPNCKILLVEATSPTFANLGAAVNYAATQGPAAISNSYGGSDASDADFGAAYNHAGIAVTVSSGDSGYGVQFPASSQYVVAVGGTSLTKAGTNRGWAETAWSGAGSGCSAFNVKPAWQGAPVDTGCNRRAVADVSAVADPATGVAVYDSTRVGKTSGWLVFGGTSVSAPIIAGVYALAGNAASAALTGASYPYAHPGALFDVTTGSNGTCPTTQWCQARGGWDGPTGLGTPNGVGAF